MSKTAIDQLDEHGIDPLLDSAMVCAAEGDCARETLSRRISRGEFPKPDRVISGRNFWYRSTYLAFREQEQAFKPHVELVEIDPATLAKMRDEQIT